MNRARGATKQQLLDENTRLRESCDRVRDRLTKHRNDAVRLRNILAQLVHHQDAAEMEDVDEEDRAGFVPSASPGHRHNISGHWDANGRVCRQCESWAAARKILKEG